MQDIYTCEKKAGNIAEMYQLRHAGGLYWLLDMKQSGNGYNEPVPINAAGAEIWKMLVRGMNEDEISERLCEKYGVPKSEAKADVHDFVVQLQTSKA